MRTKGESIRLCKLKNKTEKMRSNEYYRFQICKDQRKKKCLSKHLGSSKNIYQ